MKIIVSHDVDHMSVEEHLGDLIIPKFIGLSSIELLKGNISSKTYLSRMSGLFRRGAWNNLGNLIEFDKRNNVKSTFFVAVNRGMGLNYPMESAKSAIDLIRKNDFDVGVHGISFMDFRGIKREFDAFKDITGEDDFGIRMHYLQIGKDTLKHLEKAGYVFDTSIYSSDFQQPYPIGDMMEIPLHIMDFFMFWPEVKKLSLRQALTHNPPSAEAAIDKTKTLIEGASKKGEIINILIHQRYFSDEFPAYKRWYEGVIEYAKEKGFRFIGYKELTGR